MRWFFFALLMSLSTSGFSQNRCEKPWLFFDLGNVIIDTQDWDRLRYMQGALDYLHQLHRRGYPLGLIVNVPEEWGSDLEKKITTLKNFIARTWFEPNPFEWDLFQRIILPENNSERKPAPILFRRAQLAAVPCKIIYQGENVAELQAAARVGLKTFRVGHSSAHSFYLPEDQIIPFVAHSP